MTKGAQYAGCQARSSSWFKESIAEDALKILGKSLLIFEKLYGTKRPEITPILLNIGITYQFLHRYDDALMAFSRALPLYKKEYGRDHPFVAHALSLRGFSQLLAKAPTLALEDFRRATKILVTSTRSKNKASWVLDEVIRHRNAFLGLIRTASFITLNSDDLNGTLEMETFDAAQWASRTSASEALSQLAARIGSGSDALSKLVRKRQDLVREATVQDKVLLVEITKPSDKQIKGRSDELRNRLEVIEGRVKKIDAQLEKDFPEYADLSNPKPLSITETQEQLRAKEALIQFMFANDEGFAWLMTKTGAKWVRLDIKLEDLKRMVSTLRKGLDRSGNRARSGQKIDVKKATNDNSQGLKLDLKVAHKLHDILLGQFKDELTDIEHLMIVPDGTLQSLPPSVLVTEKPAKQYETYRGLAKTP